MVYSRKEYEMKGYNGRARDLHFDRKLYDYLSRFDEEDCEEEQEDEYEPDWAEVYKRKTS